LCAEGAHRAASKISLRTSVEIGREEYFLMLRRFLIASDSHDMRTRNSLSR
jgi:hypothetical protein